MHFGYQYVVIINAKRSRWGGNVHTLEEYRPKLNRVT